MPEHSSNKVYVLDTSVLVHDPCAYRKFQEHSVAIPITVIEELDELRRQPDLVGLSARIAVREIGALGNNARLPDGGTLLLIHSYVEPRKLPGKLADIPDHRIIGVALQLAQQRTSVIGQRKGKTPAWDVVLVSKDHGQRLKAQICGLQAEDYENDVTVHDFAEIPSGRIIIDLPETKDGKTLGVYLKGSDPIPMDLVEALAPERRFYPNACCTFQVDGRVIGGGIFKEQLRKVLPVPIPTGSNGNGGGISPANLEQAFALQLVLDPTVDLVTLTGQAGTGKTLMALLAAWKMLRFSSDDAPHSFNGAKIGSYDSITIYRPNIEIGQRIGYLRGGLDEKFAPWKVPIADNLRLILGPQGNGGDKQNTSFSDTLAHLTEQGLLSIDPINFVRGRSMNGVLVILDEAQNLTPHEVKTMVTRAGRRAKFVMTGDLGQIDHPQLTFASSGLTRVITSFTGKPNYGNITLWKSQRSLLAAQGAELL